MTRAAVFVFTLFLYINTYAQSDLQRLSEAEQSFEQALASQGTTAAYQNYLLPDALLFRPNAVNGLDYFRLRPDQNSLSLVRRLTDADVSSNGLLGYTTGDWRLYEKGKSEATAKFGQSVTIWQKNGDGKFMIALDIGIMHDKLTFSETDRAILGGKSSDPNKRGWSPADASMNFLKLSMNGRGLADGYERYAADDVRLLIEQEPPIIGKKRVVSAMKDYISIAFPRKVASFQSADMAYTWNPCEFDNNGEGTEKGNCLHVWKLRNKKWWIVLGVFARVAKEVKPTLKTRTAKSQNHLH